MEMYISAAQKICIVVLEAETYDLMMMQSGL
jgi:hypothetical protein